METLGQKIRALRKARGMTQAELARGLATASMISQIESDRTMPSAQLLTQIAARLGVDVSEFQKQLAGSSEEAHTYRRAKQLAEQGHYEEAIRHFLSLSWPLHSQFRPELVFQDMGDCYLKAGDYEQAARLYDALVFAGFARGDMSSVVRGYYYGALARRRLQRDEEAILYLQRARQALAASGLQMPLRLKIEMTLARLLLQYGPVAEARSLYEGILARDTEPMSTVDRAHAHHGLACAAAAVGDYRAAIEHAGRAIELHEDAGNRALAMRCRINLGAFLRLGGDVAGALSHLLDLEDRTSPRDEVLRVALDHELALTYQALHQPASAMDRVSRALAMTRVGPEIRAQLHLLAASLNLELGDLDRAELELRALDALVAEHPDIAPSGYLHLKAEVYLHKGSTPEILQLCEEAVARETQRHPERPWAAPDRFWLFPRQ
ncbi:helix-turn-helix domain-containing protein [Alicyclobacillus acidocaldarius]|uniref:Transcriptional regulator, XRE family n=1 Tax=Alicyclobacillus acidocaldarius (strain Tc-4-1) TaxID=1048834 RepID=F8IKJ7_ALIAT|nr:helix-turn-helix transcriptional regulator [Alicyclobacillus acidocaldarius]AEJ43575.1 transcriptional regulator, XRE family [Alicyclobacillus acidocaldarius subsp. acidocaldarius Tc-4-1]